MQFFTQKTDGYIGNTNVTVRSSGCLGTCIGMVLEVNPKEIFAHPEYFGPTGLLIDPAKLASDFGANFDSRRDVALNDPVVCEVKFDSSQHFVVRYDGRIYDPLSSDGHPLRDYVIISYRNIWRDMKPAFDLFRIPDGRVYFRTWNGYEHIPNPEEAVIHFGSEWNKYVTDVQSLDDIPVEEKINNKQIVVETQYIDRQIEVPVNITTEDEKKLFIEEYKKENPPQTITVVRDITLGEALAVLWKTIKNIKLS